MAEDHGLCNGKAPIKITERCKLVLLLITDHIELFDGVQCLLFALQLDDIGIRNHLLSKPPHRLLKGCGEKEHLTVLCQNPPMDPYALVPMTLCGDHHISLVKHKHSNLVGVNKLVLRAPVEHCAWSSNDNLFLWNYNYGQILTSVSSNAVGQFDIRAKCPHLLDYLTNLQSELVCWRDAKALKEPSSF
uniref:Uncharacterized protein n=1 Tax=Cyclopterus lumpus TaxID=8103 RepID=A0A8C2WPX3_CYCLU